jgi:transcriptional regulator with XRE-family HTH domain
MPRKPKQSHPLREVRAVLGWTQPQLAAKLGIHETYVRKIELGSRPLTEELARRIEGLTGARSAEFLKGRAGKALDYNGAPYSLKSFKLWSGFLESQKCAEIFSDWITHWTRVLFLAAGKKKCLKRAQAEIAAKLDEVAKSFRLRPEIDRCLRKAKVDEIAELHKIRPSIDTLKKATTRGWRPASSPFEFPMEEV